MTSKRKDDRRQVHIPGTLYDALRAAADERVVSVHFLCERLLADSLTRLPPLPGRPWFEAAVIEPPQPYEPVPR